MTHYFKTNTASCASKAHGHKTRRLIHLSMACVPVLYGFFLNHIEPTRVRIDLFCFLFFVLFVESMRLFFKIRLFGQRVYEQHCISALTWTVCGLILTVLYAPLGFATSIIWTAALVDPVMGELRLHGQSVLRVLGMGLVVATCIWLLGSHLFHIHFLWVVIMAPLSIALEFVYCPYVDDNALMLLVPLVIVCCGVYIF